MLDAPSSGTPFVMVPVSVLEAGLSPQAFMTYAALRRHADNETHETWIGREKIAGYLGLRKVASVDRYVRELVDAGLITSEPRWCAKHDNRVWSRKKDADHTVQGSNLYTITAGQKGSLSGDPVGPFYGAPGVPQKGHELDPGNYTQGTTTDVRSAEPPAESRSVDKLPVAIPESWTPGKFHRSVAERNGINVDQAAEYFRDGMLGDGELRADWDKAFGAFLRDMAEGRSEVTFRLDYVAAEVDAAVDRIIAARQVEAVPVVDVETHPESGADRAADARTGVAEGTDTDEDSPTVLQQIREVMPWLMADPELSALAESMNAEGRSFYAIKAELDVAERRRRGTQGSAA